MGEVGGAGPGPPNASEQNYSQGSEEEAVRPTPSNEPITAGSSSSSFSGSSSAVSGVALGPSFRLKSVPSSHWDSHFFFPLPPRAWSTTTARMVSGSHSRIRVSVLMVIVVALQLATVSYDEGVSKRSIQFSCYCRNSPKQVLPASLSSSSSVVVIMDDSVYSSRPCLPLC
jgi:hypothetical protein